jgi:hypothetical protein
MYSSARAGAGLASPFTYRQISGLAGDTGHGASLCRLRAQSGLVFRWRAARPSRKNKQIGDSLS